MKTKAKSETPAQLPTISKELKEAIDSFQNGAHRAKRLSRNIRTVILEILQHDGMNEAEYLQDLAYDLVELHKILDVLEDEAQKQI